MLALAPQFWGYFAAPREEGRALPAPRRHLGARRLSAGAPVNLSGFGGDPSTAPIPDLAAPRVSGGSPAREGSCPRSRAGPLPVRNLARKPQLCGEVLLSSGPPALGLGSVRTRAGFRRVRPAERAVLTRADRPWTNVYGLGRSMLGLATLLTLLTNPAKSSSTHWWSTTRNHRPAHRGSEPVLSRPGTWPLRSCGPSGSAAGHLRLETPAHGTSALVGLVQLRRLRLDHRWRRPRRCDPELAAPPRGADRPPRLALAGTGAGGAPASVAAQTAWVLVRVRYPSSTCSPRCSSSPPRRGPTALRSTTVDAPQLRYRGSASPADHLVGPTYWWSR